MKLETKKSMVDQRGSISPQEVTVYGYLIVKPRLRFTRIILRLVDFGNKLIPLKTQRWEINS